MTSKMKTISKRAGAELGQAQLKFGFDFNFCKIGLVELVLWI